MAILGELFLRINWSIDQDPRLEAELAILWHLPRIIVQWREQFHVLVNVELPPVTLTKVSFSSLRTKLLSTEGKIKL